MDFSCVEYDVDSLDGHYVKRTDPATGEALPEHNWLWAPTGVIDAHMPEMWGYLVFTKEGEEYPLPADDRVKFALRRLYYCEYRFCCENGCFSADVQALLGAEADEFGVQVWVTPSMFEGVAHWQGEVYHIDQDGYVWQGEKY